MVMTLRQAAQQALEALELAQTDVHWELHSPTRKFLRKAEKSLRAALAEQPAEQEPVEVKQIAEALRQVGLTLIRAGGSFRVMDLGRIEAQTTPTQPAQQQEPVAWMWKDGTLTSDPDRADGTWTPLYTAPQPHREVELTDEEIERALDAANVPELPDGYESVELEIARAVIAAYKAKQGEQT